MCAGRTAPSLAAPRERSQLGGAGQHQQQGRTQQLHATSHKRDTHSLIKEVRRQRGPVTQQAEAIQRIAEQSNVSVEGGSEVS